MSPHGTAVMARHVRRASESAVGFAVRDGAGRGCAFEIDQSAGEALVFGASSPVRVTANNVLPAHFVVLPHDGILVAASASSENPALVNGVPLPTSWTVLQVPSRIRIGGAAVDFFFVRESGTVLVDLDVETTVPDAGRSVEQEQAGRSVEEQLHTPIPSTSRSAVAVSPLPPRLEALERTRVDRRMLPPPLLPPKRHAPAPLASLAFAPVLTPRSGVSSTTARRRRPVASVKLARGIVYAGYLYARLLWQSATMTTRMLLGVSVVLLAFVVIRLAVGHSHATTHAPPASSVVVPIPTGVPMNPIRVVNEAPAANAVPASIAN